MLAADYEAFRAALPDLCADLDVDADNLAFKDFVWIAARWVEVGVMFFHPLVGEGA